jgi:hypothetical protein
LVCLPFRTFPDKSREKNDPTQKILSKPLVTEELQKKHAGMTSLDCLPQTTATLDMDATFSEARKKAAPYCSNKFEAYQPLNICWAEQGLMVYSEFRVAKPAEPLIPVECDP